MANSGEVAAVQAGLLPWEALPAQMYVEGHNHCLGYAVSFEYMDAPPARYMSNLRKARVLVERFNRMSIARAGKVGAA